MKDSEIEEDRRVKVKNDIEISDEIEIKEGEHGTLMEIIDSSLLRIELDQIKSEEESDLVQTGPSMYSNIRGERTLISHKNSEAVSKIEVISKLEEEVNRR